MTKLRLLAIAMLVIVMAPFADPVHATSSSPQGINYQSVARDASGQILANQPIHLRLSIRDSSAAGAIVYQEHHQVVTNAFGTFSVVIGAGGIIQGNFGGIAWGAADKYLQADMDFAGGNNYRPLGTTKILSVAYALYAGTSAADISNIKYDTTGVTNIKTAGNNYTINKPVWLAGGNSGLSIANNWLGTLDNSDVIIKQGSVEAIRYTKGGAILATGGPAGTTPVSGPGKRMEWIPAKGAFRAGMVTGSQWDDAYIGTGSVATGTNAVASGVEAIAMGTSVQALDTNTIALGSSTVAKSSGTVVTGVFNDTALAPADTTAGDKALFQVGRGTSDLNRANALQVQRDGDVYAEQLILSRTLTTTPASVSTLIGPVTADVSHVSFLKVNTIGVPLSSTLNLSNGSKTGQILVIQSVASLLGISLNYGFKILSTSNTKLSQTYSMYNGDMLTLVWDGAAWVQLNWSHN